MPIWLAARERTSALIDRKCWDAVRAAVRARYWKQLFPGVVAFLRAMHTAASDGSHPWQWPVVHAAGGTGTWSTASGTTEWAPLRSGFHRSCPFHELWVKCAPQSHHVSLQGRGWSAEAHGSEASIPPSCWALLVDVSLLRGGKSSLVFQLYVFLRTGTLVFLLGPLVECRPGHSGSEPFQPHVMEWKDSQCCCLNGCKSCLNFSEVLDDARRPFHVYKIKALMPCSRDFCEE